MSGNMTDSVHEREVIVPDFTRDIPESDIPRDVLDILLADRTTGKNIMWMTTTTGDIIFFHNGFSCDIMDWTHKEPLRYADLIKMNQGKRNRSNLKE